MHINTVVISFLELDCDEMTCFVDYLTTTERLPGFLKKPDSSTLKIACVWKELPRVYPANDLKLLKRNDSHRLDRIRVVNTHL